MREAREGLFGPATPRRVALPGVGHGFPVRCARYPCAMPPAPETKPTELADMLARLEDQMRRMHDDLDTRLDAIAESLEARGADEEVEALAAERIRSGAAERTQDGAGALAELGIHTR